MAAAKKAAKKAPATAGSAATADTTPGLEELRIKYDPVMIALSKAEAARMLLVNAGDLFEREEDLDWIEGFADDALVEALEEARTAYVKAVGKTTPAAEAAR